MQKDNQEAQKHSQLITHDKIDTYDQLDKGNWFSSPCRNITSVVDIISLFGHSVGSCVLLGLPKEIATVGLSFPPCL
jgi:hypothetical protein